MPSRDQAMLSAASSVRNGPGPRRPAAGEVCDAEDPDAVVTGGRDPPAVRAERERVDRLAGSGRAAAARLARRHREEVQPAVVAGGGERRPACVEGDGALGLGRRLHGRHGLRPGRRAVHGPEVDAAVVARRREVGTAGARRGEGVHLAPGRAREERLAELPAGGVPEPDGLVGAAGRDDAGGQVGDRERACGGDRRRSSRAPCPPAGARAPGRAPGWSARSARPPGRRGRRPPARSRRSARSRRCARRSGSTRRSAAASPRSPLRGRVPALAVGVPRLHDDERDRDGEAGGDQRDDEPDGDALAAALVRLACGCLGGRLLRPLLLQPLVLEPRGEVGRVVAPPPLDDRLRERVVGDLVDVPPPSTRATGRRIRRSWAASRRRTGSSTAASTSASSARSRR